MGIVGCHWVGAESLCSRLNHSTNVERPRAATCLIALLTVERSVVAGAADQLVENVVVNGQQPTVALVALAAIAYRLSQLLPLIAYGFALGSRIGSEQA